MRSGYSGKFCHEHLPRYNIINSVFSLLCAVQYVLLHTHYVLHTYLLRATYYVLPTMMHYAPRTTYYALFTAYCALYTTCTMYYMLPTMYYILLYVLRTTCYIFNTKYCYFYYLLLLLLLLLLLCTTTAFSTTITTVTTTIRQKACLVYVPIPIKHTHVEYVSIYQKIAKSLAIVAIDYTVLPPLLAVVDWVVGTNNGVDKLRDNDQISLNTLLFWMTGVPTST